MIVIDKNTQERLGIDSSGTKIVKFLTINSKTIKDLQFGTSSRGTINELNGITFEGCTFRYVTFSEVIKVNFTNCVFYKCIFDDGDTLNFESCYGDIEFGSWSKFNILNVDKCDFRIEYMQRLTNFNKLNITDSPSLDSIKQQIEQQHLEYLKKLEEEKELRAKLKYGYKVVFTPVLVKLSFPDDAELVNLKLSKSRASKAFVESVTMIKNFEGDGITNYSYSDILNYKVGEVVYPDKFDNNTNETCGHGIHFCVNPGNIPSYVSLGHAYDDFLKLCDEINNENGNNN